MQTIDTGMPVGVTADIEGSDDIILAGAKDGITKFNLTNGKHEYIAKFWADEDPDKAKRLVNQSQRCESTNWPLA